MTSQPGAALSADRQALLRLRLAGRASPAASVIPAAGDTAAFCSFAQQRLWFLHQLDPGRTDYNVPSALRLTGPLDHAALRRALTEITARHHVLRTRFEPRDGIPVPVLDPVRPVELPLTDVCGLGGAAALAKAAKLAAQDAAMPFDLAAGPLLRARLVRLAEADHVLALVLHHIAFDDGSAAIFQHELSVLYQAFLAGQESPLPPLPIQYADFAAWQREKAASAEMTAAQAYWAGQLAGLERLSLPTDHPRPARLSGAGRAVTFTVPGQVEARLRDLAQRSGVTMFMVLAAAYAALLARQAGQTDVAVGAPMAGREEAETEGLIGFFANTLVLRADLTGDPSFAELLGRVRQTALAAYSHREMPFEHLVERLAPERGLASDPLLHAWFSHEEAAGPQAPTLPGLRAEPVPVPCAIAKFDLSLTTAAVPGGIAGSLAYRTELFRHGTAAALVDRFMALLSAMAADPAQRVSRAAPASAAELAAISTWSRGPAAAPAGLLHEMVSAQASRTPDSVAVTDGTASLSYAELDERAGRLAGYLRGLGAGPEVVVGICLNRSPDLVVAVLAVLRAGGAYLPLDPGLPLGRLTTVLGDASAGIIVTSSGILDTLPALPAVFVCVDDPDEAAAVASAPEFAADLSITAAHPSYLIYTSGSTGAPKGVVVTHAGLANYVSWAAAAYGLAEGSVAVCASPLSFDFTITTLLVPLVRGGLVHTVREDGLDATGQALAAAGRVRLAKLTPAALSLAGDWLPADAAGPAVLVAGGEALSGQQLARWRERVPDGVVINEYGPTETVVGCCAADVTGTPGGETVPIGRPVANTVCLILDASLSPCPAGLPGEIYVGGSGLARGYAHRPDLTAACFVADPGGGGARLYRTGDIGRWRADGTLEFLGRADDQVKIRGYRVEPAETAAALLAHPGVRDAAVTATSGPGERRLTAYIVPRDRHTPVTAAELRAFLGDRVPSYLAPAAYVTLDALPRTRNGKLDRRALPAPAPAGQGTGGYQRPRTLVAEIIAATWADVLGVAQPSGTDDFFALGGHSLLATRAAARLASAFGTDIQVRLLFDYPVLDELASQVGALLAAGPPGAAAAPPVVPVPRSAAMPLSPAQRRLWFLHQLAPASAEYNVAFAARLTGDLDAGALHTALTRITARHENLRTAFPATGGHPTARIGDPAPMPLDTRDLAAAGDPVDQARQVAAALAVAPFDLAAGPLLRAALLRLGPRDHVLVLAMHHIVCDEWSVGIVCRELSAHYTAIRTGQPHPLPPLPVQFADYAAWQRAQLSGDGRGRALAYWTGQLAGLTPADLPSDRPRPAVRSAAGASVTVRLDPGLTSSLRELSRRSGTTMFMTLLAGFAAVLARYTGSTDVAVGSPVSGRGQPETEHLIGFFVNTVVLRTDLSGDPTFAELLRRVRETALGAYTHADLPFEQLVEHLRPDRDPSRNPLFQVMLVYQADEDPCLDLAGIQAQRFQIPFATAQFDLVLTVSDQAGHLAARLEYAADLFDEAGIERLASHLVRMLSAAAADPAIRVGSADVLGGHQRERIRGEHPTAAAAPELAVHEVSAAWAAAAPESIALVDGDHEFSYGELHAQANRLAAVLRGLGAGPETPVGLIGERSADLILGLLAILKAGAAYLPLEPDQAPERLAYMLADSGARLVVAASATAASALPATEAIQTVVLSDPATRELAASMPPDDPPRSRLAHLAYLIYTSGSTGQPKAVAVSHASLASLMVNLDEQYQFGPGDTWSACHSHAFDFSVWELWGALYFGGRLVIVPAERTRDPQALYELLAGAAVTVLSTTPTAFAGLAAHATARPLPPALRLVVFGGEALDTETVSSWFATHGAQRPLLVNMYGITETTIHATQQRLPAAGRSPIGRPLRSVRAYLLDRHLNPVPQTVTGELYLGGAQLARGYAARPGLTAERFVADPFGGDGGRLYRTGDLARWRGDGTLEYVGRADQQVKIRGHRVELGEIEAVLRRHPAVAAAAAAAPEGRLVAYLVTAAGWAPLSLTELREYAATRLPQVMVPAAVVQLGQLPVTANGKLDRAALPAPDPARPELSTGYREPGTPAERLIAAAWAEVLGVDQVGADDNFFELGGDSVSSIQVVSRLRAAGLEVTPAQVFTRQTVAVLALAAAPRAGGIEADERQSGPDAGPVPLTPIQRWLLGRDLPRPEFYTQWAWLAAGPDLDPGRLSRAVRHLLARHDALRWRFTRRGDGNWSAQITPADQAGALATAWWWRTDGQTSGQLAEVAARACESIDLARGPLGRVVWIDDPANGPAKLLIVVHHLAVDAVSWPILLDDLAAAYHQITSGEPVTLGPRTATAGAWAAQLAQAAAPQHQPPPTPSQQPLHWLIADQTVANAPGSADAVRVTLGAEDTRLLTQVLPTAAHAGAHHALLAAIAHAAAALTGRTGPVPVTIDVEGHGRHLLPGIDLSRTVGWFTTIRPVTISADPSQPPAAALAVAKTALAGQPHPGQVAPAGGIMLNYLGNTDSAPAGDRARLWRAADGPALPLHRTGGTRSHELEITALITGGQLTVQLTYLPGRHHGAAVARLADRVLAALRTLAAINASEALLAVSPADFPAARVTPRELAELVTRTGPVADLYPLTPTQAGLLYHSLLDPGSGVYLEQLEIRLSGELDATALRTALGGLMARHEVLRSAVHYRDLAEPHQAVLPVARVSLPFASHDIAHLDTAGRAAAFRDIAAADRARGIGPDSVPLWRATLVSLSHTDHRMLLTHHHLILDGWSLPILLQDFGALYEQARTGRPAGLPALRPYRDLLVHLASSDMAAADAYWQQLLADIDHPTPMPLARPAGTAPGGQRFHHHQLTPTLTAELTQFARTHRLTLNTLIRGGWAVLLHIYSGESPVVFGATSAGRPAELAGMDQTAGLFITTTPVRADITAGPVLEMLRALQNQQSASTAFEHTPLTRVHGHTGIAGGAPLFHTLVVFENYPALRRRAPSPSGQPAGLDLSVRALHEQVNYPLALITAPDDPMTLTLAYDPAVYPAAVVASLAGHLETVLASLAADPARPASDVSCLRPGERAAAVATGQRPGRGAAPQRGKVSPVPQQIAAMARTHPAAPALITDETTLSYGELDERAAQLAGYLLDHGSGPDIVIGICLSPGIGFVVALLAVLYSGAGYLPLDPAEPARRREHMLRESGAMLVLTADTLAAVSDGRASTVPSTSEPAHAGRHRSPPAQPGPASLAYLLFTSGSTGEPKGTAVTHRNLANLSAAQREIFGLGPGDRVVQFAPVGYDASVWEIVMALTSGAALVLPQPGQDDALGALARALTRHNVTAATLPPSVLAALPPSLPGELTALHTLVSAGEALPAATAAAWAAGRRLINAYGPTETTVCASLTDYKPADGRAPLIGRPLPGADLYVLGSRLEPVPPGAPGELFIGGLPVARGYPARPDLTAQRFVADPFAADGSRLYRSGDLARWWPDGQLEFLTRADEQLKVRGIRIEPAEVEAALTGQPGISQAAVTAAADGRLLACLVPAAGQPLPTVTELRGTLRDRLPEAMLPTAVIPLTALPRTSSGKIDRRALRAAAARAPAHGLPGSPPAPGAQLPDGDTQPPASDTEQHLASLWRDVLGTGRAAPSDDFFELGGHSLHAARLLTLITRSFGVTPPLRALLERPVLRSWAEIIDLALDAQLAEMPPAEIDALIAAEEHGPDGTPFP